ncbi:hypothetical protein [Kiloniella sp.]|uniref:hypothetical protein n=1 Tax=Kiloniella sp. TaxID=1938587 RepID=UPI003B01FE5C
MMRNQIDQLVLQVEQIIKDKENINTQLSLSEEKAVQRIYKISNRFKLMNANDAVVGLVELEAGKLTENVRSGCCDGNAELYQKLYMHTHSKLELISPDSLKGYVGLLE